MRWQGLAITHYEGDNLTSLKLTAKAPENGWGWKTTSFLLRNPIFSRATVLVSLETAILMISHQNLKSKDI